MVQVRLSVYRFGQNDRPTAKCMTMCCPNSFSIDVRAGVALEQPVMRGMMTRLIL